MRKARTYAAARYYMRHLVDFIMPRAAHEHDAWKMFGTKHWHSYAAYSYNIRHPVVIALFPAARPAQNPHPIGVFVSDNWNSPTCRRQQIVAAQEFMAISPSFSVRHYLPQHELIQLLYTLREERTPITEIYNEFKGRSMTELSAGRVNSFFARLKNKALKIAHRESKASGNPCYAGDGMFADSGNLFWYDTV